MAKNKILYNSEESAQPATMNGWVSADGHFWVNKDDEKFAEHHARWGGCTHLICECGNEHDKHWTCCTECLNKKSMERYNKKPFEEYKGQPVCIYGTDDYFFNQDDIDYYMDNNEITDKKTLKLVVCEPCYMREFEVDDIYADELPDDLYIHDVAPNIADKIEELNLLIRKERPILSWVGGKKRTEYK